MQTTTPPRHSTGATELERQHARRAGLVLAGWFVLVVAVVVGLVRSVSDPGTVDGLDLVILLAGGVGVTLVGRAA